jgi:hypothetical protein
MPNLQFTNVNQANITHLVNACVFNQTPNQITLYKTDGTNVTIAANFGYGLLADFDITKVGYNGNDYFPEEPGPPSPTGITRVTFANGMIDFDWQ